MEKVIAIFIVMLAAIVIGCFAFRKNKACSCKSAKNCTQTDCPDPNKNNPPRRPEFNRPSGAPPAAE